MARSKKEVIEIVNKFGYELLYEYVKRVKRVVIKDKCNYKYDTQFGNFLNGRVPDFVSIYNPFSIENISLWLQVNNKNFILLEGQEYKNSLVKLRFHCNICDDVFVSSWNNVHHGFNCGVCDGKQVGEKHSLLYIQPNLAKEWDYEKNKISPNEVTLFSNKNAFWVCSKCNYHWKSSIGDRQKYGCPSCAGQVVSDKNRLSILFPELILEWDFIKNKGLTPDNVCYGSEVKVWWKCRLCGYEWKASINSRAIRGSCCINCYFKRGGESKIANKLKLYFKNTCGAIIEYRILKNPDTNRWLPFDIYIPDRNIFIEVHGEQHYKFNLHFYKNIEEFKYRKKLDRVKRKFARKKGTYIEVDLRKIKTVKDAVDYIDFYL